MFELFKHKGTTEHAPSEAAPDSSLDDQLAQDGLLQALDTPSEPKSEDDRKEAIAALERELFSEAEAGADEASLARTSPDLGDTLVVDAATYYKTLYEIENGSPDAALSAIIKKEAGNEEV